MAYLYLLGDDSGVSNSENEILLPKGSTFFHQFGQYKVIELFKNEFGEVEVLCERMTRSFTTRTVSKHIHQKL